MDFNEYILQWKQELLNPTISDVLVNIDEGKNALALPDSKSENYQETVFLQPSNLLKRLTKKSQISNKNRGVATLGVSYFAIRFSFEDKLYFSPLLIANATAKYSRIRSNFEISIAEDFYFNPFLQKLLNLDDVKNDISSIQSLFAEKGLEYTLVNQSFLGNFHPHRFIILKEIEALGHQQFLSSPLSQLFGDSTTMKPFELDLSHQQLVFSDEYQASVLKGLQKTNIVLQGPPGTGKSDVITNAIAKSIASNYSSLLIAEHETAVNVIVDKLKGHNIHHFCAKLHHRLSAKAFIEDLKASWQFLENYKSTYTKDTHRSYFMTQNLQLLLDKLNSTSFFGGLDFGEFKEKWANLKVNPSVKLNNVPDIDVWMTDREKLREILSIFKKRDTKLWTYFNTVHLKDIRKVQHELNRVLEVLKKLKISESKISDFEQLHKKALFAQSFFYNDQLLNRDLFVQNSSSQKEFKQLLNQLKQVEEEIALYQNEKDNWNKQLNESELFDFLAVLQNNDKFSLSNWIKKREIKKASKFDLSGAKVALENLIHLKKLEKKRVEIKGKIRTLDLPDDLTTLSQIDLLIKTTQSTSTTVYKDLIELSEDEIIRLYKNIHLYQTVHRFLKQYLLFKPEIAWSAFWDDFRESKQALLGCKDRLAELSITSKQMIYELELVEEIKDLDALVFHSHWKFLSARFPQLTSLEADQIGGYLDEIIEQTCEDQKDFGLQLVNKIKGKFDQAHHLLQIPARKLSQDEKQRKVRLRKGKSILVKQFAKSRNHMSPLEILSSEAKEWVAILKPVITGSSVSVAENLPFQRESFDLVLFDEASQVNLSHAVGGVFRAKRVLVAGDRQQMPPSNLFNKNKTSIDLLSQSSYYWENKVLHYHYRSHHPELIAFSNQYFYENKLRAFAFSNAAFPIEVINVRGVFTDRINEVEAKTVANLVTQKITRNIFDFGLVAFSQKQLDLILDSLESVVADQLVERQEDLLISSLEHVQGEQCDHLIISMGYGYNEEGKFLHQFGPLNQEGGHRRLNVLMSRARKKITFVRSVNENDFKISDNDGVDMLRKLMLYLSSVEKENNAASKPKNKNDHLVTLARFYKTTPDALNLLSVHHVLKNRNWELKYTF